MLDDSKYINTAYERLNIIDTKASSLLTFNGIILAAISVWLGYIPLNFMHFGLDIIFVTLLVSSLFLLLTVFLYWAKHNADQNLAKVILFRSQAYRAAIYLSISSIAIVIIISSIHAFGTIMTATERCQKEVWCSNFFSEKVFGNVDYRKP